MSSYTVTDPKGKNMISFGKYTKLVIALVGAGIVIIGRAAGIDSAIYTDLVTVATALGVYTGSNG